VLTQGAPKKYCTAYQNTNQTTSSKNSSSTGQIHSYNPQGFQSKAPKQGSSFIGSRNQSFNPAVSTAIKDAFKSKSLHQLKSDFKKINELQQHENALPKYEKPVYKNSKNKHHESTQSRNLLNQMITQRHRNLIQAMFQIILNGLLLSIK